MRYRRIDLNLVAALDVLLTERNISRAAEVLNLSQSTVSGILARLREYFGDPLLVPVGRTLQRTPLAESLCGPARRAMTQIDALIDTQPSFDPATASLTVRIAASDYVVATFLSDALQHIARLAPGLAAPDQPSATLFEDGYTVLAWTGNRRLGDTFTFDDYRALGHVVFHSASASGGMPWFEQWYRNHHGDTRRIEVRAAAFSLLGPLVVGTDRLATVQTRLAQRMAQALPLRCLPLPMEAPKLTEVLQWQQHRQDDPALAWVRGQLLGGTWLSHRQRRWRLSEHRASGARSRGLD